MPVVHSVGIAIGSSSALAVGAVVVRQPNELRNALAQREKTVVIDNPKLERRLNRIEFWQGREGTSRFIALLVAALFALAFALQYRIDVNWTRDWKLDRVDGKISLTPKTRSAE